MKNLSSEHSAALERRLLLSTVYNGTASADTIVVSEDSGTIEVRRVTDERKLRAELPCGRDRCLS